MVDATSELFVGRYHSADLTSHFARRVGIRVIYLSTRFRRQLSDEKEPNARSIHLGSTKSAVCESDFASAHVSSFATRHRTDSAVITALSAAETASDTANNADASADDTDTPSPSPSPVSVAGWSWVVGDEMRECMICFRSLPQSAYSVEQWRLAKCNNQCRQCEANITARTDINGLGMRKRRRLSDDAAAALSQSDAPDAQTLSLSQHFLYYASVPKKRRTLNQVNYAADSFAIAPVSTVTASSANANHSADTTELSKSAKAKAKQQQQQQQQQSKSSPSAASLKAAKAAKASKLSKALKRKESPTQSAAAAAALANAELLRVYGQSPLTISPHPFILPIIEQPYPYPIEDKSNTDESALIALLKVLFGLDESSLSLNPSSVHPSLMTAAFNKAEAAIGTIANGAVYVAVSRLPPNDSLTDSLTEFDESAPTTHTRSSGSVKNDWPFLGLFAGKNYEEGDIVTSYGGVFISQDAARQRPKATWTHIRRIRDSVMVRDGRLLSLLLDRGIVNMWIEYQLRDASKKHLPIAATPEHLMKVLCYEGYERHCRDGLIELDLLYRNRERPAGASIITSTSPEVRRFHALDLSLAFHERILDLQELTQNLCPSARNVLVSLCDDIGRTVTSNGVGFMANTGARSELNVRVEEIRTRKDGLVPNQTLYIATRPIRKHEEIFVSYNNSEWRRSQANQRSRNKRDSEQRRQTERATNAPQSSPLSTSPSPTSHLTVNDTASAALSPLLSPRSSSASSISLSSSSPSPSVSPSPSPSPDRSSLESVVPLTSERFEWNQTTSLSSTSSSSVELNAINTAKPFL